MHPHQSMHVLNQHHTATLKVCLMCVGIRTLMHTDQCMCYVMHNIALSTALTLHMAALVFGIPVCQLPGDNTMQVNLAATMSRFAGMTMSM